MRRRITLAAAAAALLALTPARAAVESFKIDPTHSSVEFRIRHLVGKVPGRFKAWAGTINMDPADPSTGSVEVTIQTDSIDTGNSDRDGHLKSPDFFDAASNPTIAFKSSKVTGSGDHLTVDGTLTMHGTSKPVTLDVTALGVRKGFKGSTVAGFEAKTTVNRKDFGMVWNRALDTGGFILGDDVEIEINIEAAAAPPQAAAAAAPTAK
jgi:polyisoprenoid-binding protein YceI